MRRYPCNDPWFAVSSCIFKLAISVFRELLLPCCPELFLDFHRGAYCHAQRVVHSYQRPRLLYSLGMPPQGTLPTRCNPLCADEL